jgi:hypothetical protein
MNDYENILRLRQKVKLHATYGAYYEYCGDLQNLPRQKRMQDLKINIFYYLVTIS